MRDAFIARLTEHVKKSKDIVLVTGDLGFGVLTDFAKDYPKNFINAGVAEQNMTGLASGLALEGKIAFTYSIANFPTLRCLEQIRNDAAYHDANLKIVSIGGGFSYGSLGMSHHATEDLSIMRAIPNITVTSPCCLWETEMLTDALLDQPGTCYLRLDKSNAGRTNFEGEKFEIGKIRTIREGSDITIISTGGIMEEVLEAAELLEKNHKVTTRVLSVHTLKPFDSQTVLNAALETNAIITVEENVVEGGLGGLVAETCLEAGVVPKSFKRIGMRNKFSSIVGSQKYLRTYYQMDSNSIVQTALKS